jgi:Coenzyme PQQ synthesis protein D (PqqD)
MKNESQSKPDAGGFPVVRKGIQLKEVQGQVVAVDTGTGDYHIFNGVGSLIWRGLAGGRTRASIIDELVSNYAVKRERADQDVENFLETLRQKKLLA